MVYTTIMIWIGKKKIAFIPVYRPSFDVLPPDWAQQIMRRIYFDAVPPGVDKSLRRAISTLRPMGGRTWRDMCSRSSRSISLDVPVNALAAQYEASLRNQGFNAGLSSCSVDLVQAPRRQRDSGRGSSWLKAWGSGPWSSFMS